MASISMNPEFYDKATFSMMSTLRHGHQLAVLKGAVVALAILAVGVFTMAMPSIRPASNGAMNVVSESQDQTDAEAYRP